FFYVDADGKLTGSDVDMATDIAAKFGVEVEFLRTAQSFDEVVNQVASGEADIAVSKLSATLSRAKKVLFSQPYVTLRQGLLINRLKAAQLGGSNQNLLTLLQTAPLKIGVISGTSYVGFAKEWLPKAEIHQYETPPKSMDGALQGEIDAIFYDELQLKRLIESNPKYSIELQLMLIKDQTDPIAIAVPPNDMQMLAWVNLYLETNRPIVDGLLHKYDIGAEK
ncbi:ABC transporter substrate-binding protein, partial [Paenibacillus sepulcri]|nr:ABC transporter substrate-binding protein [Paenibacillus sepulcri]